MSLTRGFSGRGFGKRDPRLPPGQYDIGAEWPVLTAEPTPLLDTSTWTFKVEGLVRNPVTWTWEELRALPESSFEGDIHCVTAWSKLGITFTGVSVDTLLAMADTLDTATHVLAHSHTGYTTNLPLEDVVGGQAWVAWEVDGRPLPRKHGGPARLLVPHLYFWKSTKWVSGLRLLDHDDPGFGKSGAITTTETRGGSSAMTVTDLPGKGSGLRGWRRATVVSIHSETETAKTFGSAYPVLLGILRVSTISSA